MGEVAKAVKAMSTEDILAFEKAGEVTFAKHTLKLSDIKVHNLISIGQLCLYYLCILSVQLFITLGWMAKPGWCMMKGQIS